MKELLTAQQAVSVITSDSSIFVGGFMCCGQALTLIDALLEHTATNLTIICNDAGIPGKGLAKLITNGKVKKLIASHIGLNPEAGVRMNNKSMEVILVPQGTLTERIRAAGAGLGGILTPTGIGTLVELDKQKISINDKDYLLELPLFADYALISADIADEFGNAFVAKARKNFNLVMATASKHCILETRKLVKVGQIDPDHINLPGIFVKSLVEV